MTESREATLLRALRDARTLLEAQVREVNELQGELHAARLQAEEGARSKAMLLATMSHEIRTPMNAIVGLSAMLVDSKLSEEQRDWVETIRTSGEHLVAVLSDILDLSKIEAGKLELEQTAFTVRSCAESTLEIARGLALAKQIELGFSMRLDGPQVVFGDAHRLRQVLLNLLSNAIKFTPERRSVWLDVTTAHAEEQSVDVVFTVTDQGPGMDEFELARVFQPFAQANASVSRKYGGTGLGLAISRGIVTQMGGRLEATSTPGKGATFTVSVRLPSEEGILVDDVVHAQPDTRFMGRSAIVIDPDARTRNILRHFGETWGLSVSASSDASALVSHQGRLDVALVDARVLADRPSLRQAISKGARCPIVVLSPYPIDDPHASADDFVITKPIRVRALRRALDLALVGSVSRVGHDTITRRQGDIMPLKLLVAEDNAVNRRVVRAMLEKLGYKPDFVTNGAEAVEATARVAYDLVFMDLQMPVLDGLAATAIILARGKAPRIVGMTANALDEDRARALDAGMSDYVTKPLSLRAVADALIGPPVRSTRPPPPSGREG